MQVQVHTDNHIPGSAELTERVEGIVQGAVGRFGERITRVVVQLSDVNSTKSGGDDKRCVMEARLAGLQPITVKHQSSSLELALDGAADKLEKTIERTIDRRDDPKRRTSFSGDQTI
jgi:ribosome-associated translation inhibitor RaiA